MQQEILHIRNSDSIYDGPNVDIELQVVQNPYYQGEVEMGLDNAQQENRMGLNDTRVITTVENIYYK